MANLLPNELFFTFKDLRTLFIKNKKKYYRIARLLFITAFCLFAVKSPKFHTEAIFKDVAEKTDHSDLLRSVLKNIPFQSSESTIISIMKSKSLLKQVISELGLQIDVVIKGKLARVASNLKENLCSELHIAVPEKEFFTFSKVIYEKELPYSFYISFLDADHFEIYSQEKQKMAAAKVKQAVKIPECEFTLETVPASISFKKLYLVKVAPWRATLRAILPYFSIRPSKSDKNILQLQFTSSSPKRAAYFLNTLMSFYQAHLKKDNDEITSQQLVYFEKRKEELAAVYEKALEEHVDYLTTNLGEEGFMSLKQEIDILEKPKEDYYTKLYEVELDLNRLSPAKQYKLKQEIDGEEEKEFLQDNQIPKLLANEKKQGISQALPHENQYASLEKRRAEVDLKKEEMASYPDMSSREREADRLVKQKEDARILLDCLENQKELPDNLSLARDPKILVSSWIKQLKTEQQKLLTAPMEQRIAMQRRVEEGRSKLKDFLIDFVDIVRQKQKMAVENEIYRKFSTLEFQGLTPETVQQLYVDYNHELDTIQVNIKQLVYLRDQILHPDAEISSLSSILPDEVSQQMIQKASLLSLELRDDANRSPKEHERLKESLITQKKFLIHHISQMVELQKLRARLIEEKIFSLQGSSVELLKIEKSLIEDRLAALKKRMGSLPKKWKLENELSLKKEICKTMMEAIAQLEESKRISHHLFQVESKPIDKALIPFQAKPARLVFYSLLAAFLGVFVAYLMHFFRFIARAPLVSLESLRFMELHASGTLSPYAGSSLKEVMEEDLETLRRLTHFIAEQKETGKGLSVSFIGSTQLPYSHNLAELLSLRGSKILLIDCSFHSHVSSEYAVGVIQYLSKEIDFVPIVKLPRYDRISSGGYVRHLVELVSQQRFGELIEDMKKQYDYILIHSRAATCSIETAAYQKVADLMVITATDDEPLRDFQGYVQWQKQKNKQCLTFVLSEG